jgi:hypothetical protein
MESPSNQFARLLGAVRRRLIVVRALERAGGCTAVACVFAGALGGMMLWRGENGLPWTVGTIALGALVGLAWGMIRRPRLLDAAILADRQWDLADLLATALAVRASDDPWARAVVAMADQRCRTLSADALLLRRWGARAWGGIGLAAALVLTLGALSSVPADSQARGLAATVDVPPAHATAQRSDASALKPDEPTTSARGIRRAGSDAARADATTSRNNAAAPSAGQGRSRPPPGAAQAGGTVGEGRTAVSSPARLPDPLDSATSSGRSGTGGGRAAGMGSASPEQTGSRGLTVGRSPQRAAPPWQSSSWPADCENAAQLVRTGRVPDTCRDVVREYFRTDAPTPR